MEYLKEEYLEAIGDKQVFVQDFHELPIKLQQEINQNRMKLKTINEVKYPLILLYFAVMNIYFLKDITKLDQTLKKLYEVISEKTVDSIVNAQEQQKAFDALLKLKKNVEEKYQKLTERSQYIERRF
jgi:hypothetical protein